MIARINGRSVEIDPNRVRVGVDSRPEGRKLPRATDLSHARPGQAEGTLTLSPYYPYRSKLESAFARSLEFDRLAGMNKGWRYEPVNFRLPGEKNFYKADFFSWGHADEVRVVVHEIKGRNKSDDRSLVKMKTAAGLNPWAKFLLWKRIRGTWVDREIQP